jgi:hypothetical protein
MPFHADRVLTSSTACGSPAYQYTVILLEDIDDSDSEYEHSTARDILPAVEPQTPNRIPNNHPFPYSILALPTLFHLVHPSPIPINAFQDTLIRYPHYYALTGPQADIPYFDCTRRIRVRKSILSFFGLIKPLSGFMKPKKSLMDLDQIGISAKFGAPRKTPRDRLLNTIDRRTFCPHHQMSQCFAVVLPFRSSDSDRNPTASNSDFSFS